MSNANDVYTTITNQIINDLEKGDLTWRKPWNSEHLTAHVVRPLRYNDIPYTGINTIVLWAAAAAKGYWSPYWMTFKQATAMKATVRKGEKLRKSSTPTASPRPRKPPKVRPNKRKSISSSSTTSSTPARSTACQKPFTRLQSSRPSARQNASLHGNASSLKPRPTSPRVRKPHTTKCPTASKCRPLKASPNPRATTQRWRTRQPTGQNTLPASTAISTARNGATKATHAKNWSQNLGHVSSPPTWVSDR